MAEAKTKTAAQKAAPKSTAAPKKSPATKPAAAPKPATKAAAVKKPAAEKPAAAAKKATTTRAKKPVAPAKLKPGPEELYRMIQTAAYFIAERNGFAGNSKEYWAQAEAQILSLIG
jgi:hypothetical protein